MPYLHCPHCQRTAWLQSTGEPGLRCRHCDATLTPMPEGDARFLAAAVRERFRRDERLNAGRPRFVRESRPHRLAE
jgi:tRNA(Ile2) C34 agmatinyltransferase TiaS